MIGFKELFTSAAHQTLLENSSVEASSVEGMTLSLKFDSKDLITAAAYQGKADPWFSSLCSILPGKTLHEAQLLSWGDWENRFQDDQFFWEFRQEASSQVFLRALELLKAALDIYRGRDYLYEESSPLICRCFGVRESDVMEHLNKAKDPTIESLSLETKAGMGCRSCVPQMKRWMSLHSSSGTSHFYKDRSHADWLVEIDYMVNRFPEASDWKMEVESLKENMVIILYDKEISQVQEEEVSKRLQVFLAASVDEDLSFFLRRARQRSNALG